MTETPVAPLVALRPVAAADAEFLWTWFHGTPAPEWKRWDAPYFHAADDDAVPDREEFLVAQRERGGHPDHRIITADGLDVGLVTRFEERPAGGGWWELGILIFDPAHWGRGVGGRALTAWTDATFAETDAHLVTLTTWSGNERMVASARRTGYSEVGRVPEARAWDGRRWDSVRMAVLRRDWAGR